MRLYVTSAESNWTGWTGRFNFAQGTLVVYRSDHRWRNLGYIGTNRLGIHSLFYVLFTVLFAWFIYALNMLAVASVLMPLHDEVADVLSRLEGTRSDTLPPTDNHQGTHNAPARNFGVVWFVVFAVLVSSALISPARRWIIPSALPSPAFAGRKANRWSRLARNG